MARCHHNVPDVELLVPGAVGSCFDVRCHEEIDRELQRFADQAKKTLEDFKKDMPEGDLGYFKEVATVNKTLKFLKDNASAE